MRTKTIKITFCLFLCLLLSFLLLVPGFPVSAAENETKETKTITGTFNAYDMDISWDYDFSDDFFFLPSDMYYHPFAQLSLGLALSAFRDTGNKEEQDDHLKDFLQDTGFEEIDTHTYEKEATSFSVSLGIGHKMIDDVEVVALAVCGGNYGAEWASNVKIEDEEMARGFYDSAQKVKEELDSYLKEHSVGKNAKLWITGYSRGGAIANITAAECTDSGIFQDVYAYTFAAPRTTREPADYRNIFNVIRKADPIPKIPLSDWEYQRFGIDKMIVSQETDTDCEEIVENTAENYRKMIGSEMVRNGEINYQLRIIMDYLLYLLPDSSTYARMLQPLLLDILTGSDETGSALEVLSDALSKFSAEDETQEAELKQLQDYLETILNLYLFQKMTDELPPSQWDQKFGIKNLFSEHFPFKYLAAMFSTDDPDELFSDNTSYVRLVIYGKVDAEIYDGDVLLKTVLADKTQRKDGIEDASDFYPRVEYYEDKMVISLTADRSYLVEVTSAADLPQILAYTGNLYTGDTVRAKTDPVYYCILNHGNTVNIVTSGDGKVIDPEKSDYTGTSVLVDSRYSPTVAIALEYNDIAHLTISGVLTFLMYMLLFLLVQIIASIVLAIVRKVKKKERNTAFTAVWHGVNVLLFTFCEVTMWCFIPAYPILKVIAMILTLVVLLVFAWKLYRKEKDRKMFKRFLGYAGTLAAFGLLNGFFAGKMSVAKAIILTAIYMAFFVAALLLFRRKEKKTADAD